MTEAQRRALWVQQAFDLLITAADFAEMCRDTDKEIHHYANLVQDRAYDLLRLCRPGIFSDH